jgi:hypothetical protein
MVLKRDPQDVPRKFGRAYKGLNSARRKTLGCLEPKSSTARGDNGRLWAVTAALLMVPRALLCLNANLPAFDPKPMRVANSHRQLQHSSGSWQ